MKKEMLINVLQPEECRIAILEDGVLEELYVERTSHENYTGNIYKGRVVNLEPAIQAAFVDFSVGRNGFLHVSDVEPQYYRRLLGEESELPARDRGRDLRPQGPRDEPRAPRAPRSEDTGRFLPPPLPPQIEERRPERDIPEAWDPDLGWDRPDRSEKPRRERPERRFGEGLLSEWEEPYKPAARPPITPPTTPPTTPVAPPSARRGPAADERTRPAPAPIAPTAPEPVLPVAEPTEAWVEPIESELPPSRTDRHRRVHEEVAAPEERVQEPWTRAEVPPRAPADRPERIDRRGAADPRRGRRGRGRPERTPLGAEPTPLATDFPAVPPSRLEPVIEFESELETIEDHPPRPRGRDAIRARSGERPAGRPRERERTRPVEPPAVEPQELTRAQEPGTGWGVIEPRPAVEREPRAPRTSESEAAPRRTHSRAGEPGYVPRRERTRGVEPRVEPPAPVGEWGVPQIEAPYGADVEGEAGGLDEAARRRRRRRRRPEREPRSGSPASLSGPEPLEARRPEMFEDMDLDFEEHELPPAPIAPPRRPTTGRALGPAAMMAARHDYDDFHDDEFGDEAGHPSEFETEVLQDEEIDPELEEEIRREIEEIQVLEREMGLRGTTEARPRRGDEPEAPTRGGDRIRGRGPAKPPIQDVFKRGDEVLVQVIKESIGTKGPTLSTYISIPGRYLVLMPGLNRVGVSRKIADEGQRRRLREIMHALNPPKGLGFIVRTAGLDRTKRELARDLAYLLRLWKVILKRIKKTKAPAPIYQESDMIIRTIRDIFTSEIDTIWIDEQSAYERAVEFMKVVMPKHVDRIRFYDERVPLFHKHGLEEEIAKIQRRRVDLVGGGSIVIDQTEALVAIDVNSGNFRVEDDAERTAYEMNLRAAKEIARQLRLRDLGGVIVNDFIDMRDEKHRRNVERAIRDAVKRDRARTKILRMSQFGLVEMTRQRIRPSLKRSVYEDCTNCAGAGVVKTAESMAIDVMRLLALVTHRNDVRRVQLSVAPSVAAYLNNRKRREITQIETDANLLVVIRHQESAPAEHLTFECFDAQNNEIRLFPAPPPAPARRGR